ncbi:MAG: cytochrome c oxidase assembly protein [Terracidiphilus sp.]
MSLCLNLFDAGLVDGSLREGLLRAWSFPLIPFIGLSVLAILYLRGWRAGSRTRPCELPAWRAVAFICGLLSLWIALASPIDALDDFLLSVHMMQHFILMSVAPPLLVLGAPAVPLLRGLPQWVIRVVLAPLFRWQWFDRIGRFLTHPVVAWLGMNIAYLGWHVPAAFELTFRSERIHDLEHLCFFLTSIAFWWVVLEPWPSRSRWARWTVIPYLLSADIVNTILSATLAFSGRVLYPSYAQAERISSLTPLRDQIAAGVEMWVLNSLVFLVFAVTLTIEMLSPRYLRTNQRASVMFRYRMTGEKTEKLSDPHKEILPS